MTTPLHEIPDIDESTLRRVAAHASALRPDDVAILRAQLGRFPRGLVGIGARCVCGNPAVTITYPQLPDGSPFPTLFYLTLPELVRDISRLESTGQMVEFNERLAVDEDYRHAHERAHRSYLERRSLLADVPQIANFSAGGMPDRVKCLHALAGYALAVGAGIVPVGDETLARVGWDSKVCRCEKPYGGKDEA
ncbi:DUF501 domain-containing protein [Trueperella sp. LYQ143]|uniref:DUF501 domain-containing protein n=1 Tax=unclassified Trueperella TaxID=2630174 RepID=UPI0039835CA8